jgi:hypothetical protein
MTAVVSINRIRTDGGTQTRAALCDNTVAEYGEAYKDGVEMPPVVVFDDGTDLWLADGFHRVAGAKKAGMESISAEVKEGTARDALLYSAGCNGAHGLRRSKADKEKAVQILLADEEWANKSDRWIAEKCGVSHTFVASVRESTESSSTAHDGQSELRTGKDGKRRRAKQRKGDSQTEDLDSANEQTQDDGPGAEAPGDDPEKDGETGHEPGVVNDHDDSWPLDEQTVVENLPQIPEDLKDYFAAVSHFKEAIRLTGCLVKEIQKIKKSFSKLKAFVDNGVRNYSIIETVAIKRAGIALKALMPVRPCPCCGGKRDSKCNACQGKGFQSRSEADKADSEADAGTNPEGSPRLAPSCQ